MPTVVPLTSENLEAAAELLAARQRILRRARPELPSGFEEPAAHLPGLEQQLTADGAHGVIALEGSRPVAFVLGEHRTAEIWGRAAWSPVSGSAADPELGAGAGEALRDCYADWSTHYVERGIFRHYVHAPVDDAVAVDAWFNTGFGRMQAHAVRSVAGLEAHPPAGVADQGRDRGGPRRDHAAQPAYRHAAGRPAGVGDLAAGALHDGSRRLGR